MQQQMQQQMLEAMRQIPDDIARAAHEQQLGTPQARYMITALRRGWRWPRFILTFFTLTFLLVCIAFFPIFTLSPQNIPSFNIDIFLASTIAIYAVFMGCLLAFWFTHKTYNIYPCDGGLILKQSITKFHVIRWEEIETIWHTASRAYPYWLLKGLLYT